MSATKRKPLYRLVPEWTWTPTAGLSAAQTRIETFSAAEKERFFAWLHAESMPRTSCPGMWEAVILEMEAV